MIKQKIKFDDGKYYDCVSVESSDLSKNWSKNNDRYGFDDTCVLCCKPCDSKAKTQYGINGVLGNHETWVHPKYENIDFEMIDGGYMGFAHIGSDCYRRLPKEFKEYVKVIKPKANQ